MGHTKSCQYLNLCFSPEEVAKRWAEEWHISSSLQSWTCWWFKAICSCYTQSWRNKLAVGYLEVFLLIECHFSQPEKFVNVNRSCFSICSLEKCDKDEQPTQCGKCQGRFHIWIEAHVSLHPPSVVLYTYASPSFHLGGCATPCNTISAFNLNCFKYIYAANTPNRFLLVEIKRILKGDMRRHGNKWCTLWTAVVELLDERKDEITLRSRKLPFCLIS